MPVQLGCERLLASRALDGRRVGLVCNPASVDSRLVHAADRFAGRPGTHLTALFGPQHGFRSDVQDNMIETRHGRDDVRRIPVYSLYSETREPTAKMLAGLDALVIDLQDVGSRIYTFIYTMANCLIAARRHGVKAIVCDRPNPIGGLAVEGPMLVHGYESFVGQYFDATGLPWVMPSPNMPTLDTAIVYPGSVLFEGTNVSEGRGTTRPFELVGAPWVTAERFAEALNQDGLPGVYFRPAVFEPTFQKHAKTTCGGCQLHVTDRVAFRPVETGVALIAAFRAADPGQFAWRPPPYEYEAEKMPIDILAGSADLRAQIESGVSATEIARSWTPSVDAFLQTRQKYLLY